MTTFMKSLLLGLTLAVTISHAGMRSAPASHAITSAGGNHVFTMNPGPKGNEHVKGFGICYKVTPDGRFEEIWRSSGWFSEDIHLNSDGKSLVRIGSWASGDQDTENGEESLAIAFYGEGKELRRYKISDLIKDKEKLVYSEGGLQWISYEDSYNPRFVAGGIFILRTLDGVKHRFDISNGEILTGDAPSR
jgi:hypothetical protein